MNFILVPGLDVPPVIPNPDDIAREAIWEVIDGNEFAGRTVSAFYRMPVDENGRAAYELLGPNEAAALIYSTGGTQGYVDRVDRCTVEVYAPGTAAVLVLERIRSALTNDDHPLDLQVGYIDRIVCDVLPHDVPFPVDGINQARAAFMVTSRLS